VTDNIIKLAALQEGGELPPVAEDSIALAFAERHAHELRYVAARGRWLHYDGTRWAQDDTLHAFDRARAICRETALECDKPASAVASAATVAAVERLAKADRRLAATATQWDANDWLLNAGNSDTAATFDLRTGNSRAPDPLDYITKKTACRCAPLGTSHPLWTSFVDRITDGHVELQSFLQRYIGYCCSGLTSEHVSSSRMELALTANRRSLTPSQRYSATTRPSPTCRRLSPAATNVTQPTWPSSWARA